MNLGYILKAATESPKDLDAAYEELQELDYLHEHTKEQAKRVEFLEQWVQYELAN